VDYKELAFGLEMFRDSSFDNKLKVFFDICDSDNSGAISKQEFYALLKKNLISSKLRLSMRQVVEKIFSSSLVDVKGELSFENLKIGCAQNQVICDLIIENLDALRKIDDEIDSEVKVEFNRIDPNKNDEIWRRLNGTKEGCVPGRDRKFEAILEGFVESKEQQICDLKLLKEDESF